MAPTVLGLDIGGANLKAATPDGFALQTPFPLWKHPDRLANALRRVINDAPAFDRLAVTMTGELCDCYQTKREGVLAILDAVEAALEGTAPIIVWTTDGQFVDVATARCEYLKTAASNWLATATYAGRLVSSGAAVLIDVGSTTTDIIPLWDGKPCPTGRTDSERLKCSELVYTGIRRTPVCALLGDEGMAELFATTLDVYLMLGRIPEDPLDHDTADGRPATIDFAHARLARMLGGDSDLTPRSETLNLARRVADRQSASVFRGFQGVEQRIRDVVQPVIAAGSGEFLAREAVSAWKDRRIVSLSDRLGPTVSTAAAAFAVAVLAAESTTV